MENENKRFLPLTTTIFLLLFLLWKEDSYAFPLLQKFVQRSKGELYVHPATFYRSLKQMEKMGFVEKKERFYSITPLGRDVFCLEKQRLISILAFIEQE